MSETKDRLHILLNDLNINQAELSNITSVDTAIISRLLSGEREPNVKTLRKISEATKTSPEWLLGYGEDLPRKELA